MKFLYAKKCLKQHLASVQEELTEYAHSMMPTDQRGKHKNHTHVAEKIKESLCKLIDRIPKYKSHYKDNSKVKYLSPGVHKIDVYELWTEECKKIIIPGPFIWVVFDILEEKFWSKSSHALDWLLWYMRRAVELWPTWVVSCAPQWSSKSKRSL